MPQMGPLPWIMLWAVVLGLLVFLLVLVFYPVVYKSSYGKITNQQKAYSWMW